MMEMYKNEKGGKWLKSLKSGRTYFLNDPQFQLIFGSFEPNILPIGLLRMLCIYFDKVQTNFDHRRSNHYREDSRKCREPSKKTRKLVKLVSSFHPKDEKRVKI